MVKPSDKDLWPVIRSCHLAVSLCEVSDREEESPSYPRLMIIFGRNNYSHSNLKDAWIYDVNAKEWKLVNIVIDDRELNM